MSATATSPGAQLDALLNNLAADANMHPVDLGLVKPNSPTMEKVKTGAVCVGIVTLGLGVTWLAAQALNNFIASE